MSHRAILLFLLAAVPLFAADYAAPAGVPPAARRPGAESILPGGRIVASLGQQYTTGPGPFGLAISPGGNLVVSANGGPDRYSMTILRRENGAWNVRQLIAPQKRREPAAEPEEDDWHSVFMGLAFNGEDELYASEGDSGRVRLIDPRTGARKHVFDLNQGGFQDSYTGDLALDRARGLLYVVDQANFRLVAIDTRKRSILASLRLGRLPFSIALSADGRKAYVTNIGMFEYKAVPGATRKGALETGLPFPAFGFPSPESAAGARRDTANGPVDVPGLGDPNVPESNSLAVIDLARPAAPKLEALVRTGLPFGKDSLGGSSPAGGAGAGEAVIVTNGHNDAITVVDARTNRVRSTIAIRIPGLDQLRGVLPIGLTWYAPAKWLLVAEAGINAVGVIDTRDMRLIGHLPVGWFPTRVAVDGGTMYVVNAKGHGTGPNGDPAIRDTFQGSFRRGSISVFPVPKAEEIGALTARVTRNAGYPPRCPHRQGEPHLRRNVRRYSARLQRTCGERRRPGALRPQRHRKPRSPLAAPAACPEKRQRQPEPSRIGHPLRFQRQLLCRLRSQRGWPPLAGRLLPQCLDRKFADGLLRRGEGIPVPDQGARAAVLRSIQLVRASGGATRGRRHLASPRPARHLLPQLWRGLRISGGGGGARHEAHRRALSHQRAHARAALPQHLARVPAVQHQHPRPVPRLAIHLRDSAEVCEWRRAVPAIHLHSPAPGPHGPGAPRGWISLHGVLHRR